MVVLYGNVTIQSEITKYCAGEGGWVVRRRCERWCREESAKGGVVLNNSRWPDTVNNTGGGGDKNDGSVNVLYVAARACCRCALASQT